MSNKSVLLLTNCDSDNVGDQVIEASDIALLKLVLRQLHCEDYPIISKPASIVSQEYLNRKREKDLKAAKESVQNAAVVIFGGAPVFNYLYQNFYERTAVTVDLAQQYGIPVLFSAIGIENYDKSNEKCLRIQKAVNQDCVRQITTRDSWESLVHIKENPQLRIQKVSDPAVYTASIFPVQRSNAKSLGCKTQKKVIGLFILREKGFSDNGFHLDGDQSAKLWIDTIKLLEEKGYDYRLLTSGHFADEAFLQVLIDEYGLEREKCIINMDSPQKLCESIAACDGIISCRLHPSIIAFSYGIPAIGLIWNEKVAGFYSSIGYPERALTVDNIQADNLLDGLEKAMAEGIHKNKDYLTLVYHSLFTALRDILNPYSDVKPYSYDEILENLEEHERLTDKERRAKLCRKFHRYTMTYLRRYDRYLDDTRRRSRIRYKSIVRLYKYLYHIWRKALCKLEETIAFPFYLHNEEKLSKRMSQLYREYNQLGKQINQGTKKVRISTP